MHKENEENKQNETGNLVNNNAKQEFGGPIAIISLMIFLMALSLYGETESQWFNSYVSNVSNMDYVYVSLMVSASGIVGAIAFIIWGVISDNSRSKHGRRKPMLVIGGFTTALFVILFGITTNYWWLFICDGFIIAITSNMFHVANRALVPDLWEKERRGKINSLMFIASSIGSAFIWIFALVILPEGTESYSRETHQTIFYIVGITLTIGSLAIWFGIKEPKVNFVPQPVGKSLKQLFDKKEMAKHKDFMKLFLASLFTIMATNCFKPFILIILQMISFSSTEIIIAIIVLNSTVTIVFILLFKGLDKKGRKKVTLIGCCVTPVGCFFLGFSNGGFIMALIGLGIMLPFMIGLDISVNTWTQDLLPDESRGKFLGIINIGKAAGQAPAILLAGILADNVSVLSVFVLAGIFYLLAIPLFIRVPESLERKNIEIPAEK
jgi:maltose/moltooligosaccharide transporter